MSDEGKLPRPNGVEREGLPGAKARRLARWEKDFANPSLELRRLFSEFLGTFFLVLVAAGAPTVSGTGAGHIGRAAQVTAPGLMVLAVILFMGTVSGAHLNPVVTIAFALRKDFPWKRVPAYLVSQTLGGVSAALVLRLMFGKAGMLGATVPGKGISGIDAFLMETILTLGLVSTILGTASKAQNVGTMSGVAVGSYIALAGLWASPVSGASMNPVRTFGPALVSGEYSHLWVYLAGPLLGSLLAVGAAIILRGPGGHDSYARLAAQGSAE